MEYRISVSMTPNFHDSPTKPYFWIIQSYCGKDWCNSGFGWATTPEKAWQEAYYYHQKYHKGD